MKLSDFAPEDIIFEPAVNSTIKDHMTCFACGIRHKDVEAAGIWYCPNPLCTGTGNANFRGRLKSCKCDGTSHSVNPKEWLDAALDKLKDPNIDDILRYKIVITAAKMIEE